MASYSRMITSLESALEVFIYLGDEGYSRDGVIESMKIGIRNLKSLIVCLGTLDDDVARRIERICTMLKVLIKKSLAGKLDSSLCEEVLEELQGVCKWVVAGDQLWNGGQMKLEAYGAVEVITWVLDNAADFSNIGFSFESMSSAFQVLLDSFAVQMRFIKHLLSFAMQAGVEDSLLFHIQPIAINAATVFFQDTSTSLESDPAHHFLGWSKEVESKCIRMAADPQVYQAYAQAFTALLHAPTLSTAADDKEEEDAEKEKEATYDLEKMLAALKLEEEEEAVPFERGRKEAETSLWATYDLEKKLSALKLEEEHEAKLKALLDSFISLLWDILRRQSESRVKYQYKVIYEKLRFSRAIWKKNGMDKNRRGQFGVLICDAGAFIFLLHQTDDPGRFEDLLERFDVFHAQFQLETVHSFKVNGNGRDLDYSSPASSHTITSLESSLKLVHELGKADNVRVNNSIKIAIRNLKSQIVCLGKLDDDCALRIERIYPMLLFQTFKHYPPEAGGVMTELLEVWVAGDELSNNHRLKLEADEVVSIITCAVDSTTDFLSGLSEKPTGKSTNAFEELDSFGVQMIFIKHLLCFAMQAGVEDPLLFHIQPIANNAATVFSRGNMSFADHYHINLHSDNYFVKWSKEAKSKCRIVNRMAADPQVYQAYAQALTAIRHSPTLPTDNKEEEDAEEEKDTLKAFLDAFISLLWDILRRQSESSLKDQYKLIFEKLRSSRAIWKRNGMDKNMRGDIGVLVCDAGAFIFLLHQTDDPGRFEDLLEMFGVFHANFELKTVKVDHVDQVIRTGDSTSIKVPDDDDGNGRDLDYSSPTSSHQHPQVVGFSKEDELQLLLNRLTRGSKELCIVPICGMAGLGKTTLALKLYNHPSVNNRFQARAWCPISQVLDKKKVLVQLLNQILPGDDYSKEAEQDLANTLRRSLKGRRYLILLDDIWSTNVWDNLKASFPNDSKSSRIIFTSRCLDIIPHDQHDQQPHLLRLRSDRECFAILETKVPHKESWNTELVMKIAEKCNGLPLTVTIVAGLLATSEPESWKGILDHLNSGGVSGCAESALEFSYRYLPDYLQPCLLYFGAFPEDAEVHVKRLIRMWMAEGFVGKKEYKRIEDVAQEYVEKLIERSLVMAVRRRSTGGVSRCQIHDVIHDFCRSKAKQENLFHLLLQSQDQLSDFNEPSSFQRLFIHSTTTQFIETRLFCPRAQSIFFFTPGDLDMEAHMLDMSFIIQIFRSLKVLDMSMIYLRSDIPSAIQLLTQLRYFAITSYVPVIPSSIGNLSNLETFIAHFCNSQYTDFKTVEEVSHTFWNLKKLRYLRVCGRLLALPVEDLDNPSSLFELDGVCIYSDDGSMEKQMKMFPNILNLKCTILQRSEFPSLPDKLVIPEFLESLSVRGNGGVKFELGSSSGNLRKLSLGDVHLSREGIAIIGRFPNLEVLILWDIYYLESQLEMQEEEFTKLRILKLSSSHSLKRWTCSDDQASCLEKLVFEDCENLEEIPSSCLEGVSTLEQIQVHYCSSTLESAVRNIVEVQKDYGNYVQVSIQSFRKIY